MNDIPAYVDRLFDKALARGASDVHVEPGADGYDVRQRIDGLLETAEKLDSAAGRAVVTRLMVMGQLLTYRQDIPQEGRVSLMRDGRTIDLRVSVIPTTHGLRAAVRMPAELLQPRRLEDLGLPAPVLEGVRAFARTDAGMLLVTGPAGSGKTTTLYALLQHIAEQSPGLSLITLEDPVERDLSGVTQIEVAPHGQLTYERALRSILRQDPQVLMLGEIRDAATASLAVRAALSGHRLIATLHAATAGGAIARLLEMRLEPYQVTSSLWGVITQRLLRRKADGRYRGRVPIAELAVMNPALRQAVLNGADSDTLQRLIAVQPQYQPLRVVARQIETAGLTDSAEIERVLGSESSSPPAGAGATLGGDVRPAPTTAPGRVDG